MPRNFLKFGAIGLGALVIVGTAFKSDPLPVTDPRAWGREQPLPTSAPPRSDTQVVPRPLATLSAPNNQGGDEVMNDGVNNRDATIVGWNNKAYARCGIPDFSAKPGAGEECNFYCLHNFLKLPNEKGGVIVRLIKSGKTSCEPGRINKGGYDDSQRNSSFDGPGLPRGVLRRQYTSG